MVTAFAVVPEIGFKEIGEKENFQDDKHDEQFNQDNQPDLFAPGWHFTKTFGIKTIDSPENIHRQLRFQKLVDNVFKVNLNFQVFRQFRSNIYIN